MLIAVVAVVAAVFALPQLRWRVQVLAMHASGKIPDITLRELVVLMLPGSEQSLTPLIETRNPHAVIRNFHNSPADVAAGAQLFRERCGTCHGTDAGGGPVGPSLVSDNLKRGHSDWALYHTIRGGVPGTAMVGHALDDLSVWQLIAFIRTVDVRADGNRSDARAGISVPWKTLSETREPASDWLTYSGSYGSTRHSSLTQIDSTNVRHLGVRWVYQVDGPPERILSSALVRHGVMFLTLPPNRVLALDARTGKQLWMHQWTVLEGAANGEFGVATNRGVALLDDMVFVGTGDARLIALDAATGRERWQVRVDPDHKTYHVSGAPLALRDLVVVGVGTKNGGRGFISAFDAATGKQRWRFATIPGPGEPGNDTWANDSWRQGGAPTYITGSYDSERDLLLWGVGNPKPDYDAALRAGDNLYSNSVVALRGTTGELVWHFQFSPNDDHDWDSNQIPVLADRGDEHYVLWANRNGFYYVLDRLTGKFLHGSSFVRQNWTAGLDAKGRPMPLPGGRSTAGVMVYPGNVGGTNWWSPTYVPDLDLMIVPSLEQGMVFFPSADSPPVDHNRSFYTAVRALDARTGRLVWEYAQPPRIVHNVTGGLLSTRSGLVFGSDESTFFALDARDGKPLWSVETGGLISASPVTYVVEGEQFVMIPAGRNLMGFAMAPTPSSATSAPGQPPRSAPNDIR